MPQVYRADIVVRSLYCKESVIAEKLHSVCIAVNPYSFSRGGKVIMCNEADRSVVGLAAVEPVS